MQGRRELVTVQLCILPAPGYSLNESVELRGMMIRGDIEMRVRVPWCPIWRADPNGAHMCGVLDIDRLKRHVSGAEVRLRVPAQAALKRLAAAGMKAGETR